MKIKINISLLLTCLIGKLLIDLIYFCNISPVYSYLGLINSFTKRNFIISIFYTFIIVFLLNKIIYIKKSGAVILSVLLIASAIPFSTVITFFNTGYEFIILNLIYWIIFVKIYLFKINKNKKSVIRYTNTLNLTIIYLICIIFTLTIIYMSVKAGFSLNFNLFDVYRRRSAFANIKFNTLILYIYSSSIIVFPIILIYSLREKKVFLSLVCLFSDLLVFNLDGRKSTLFVLIIAILSYLFIKNFNSKLLPHLLLSINIIGLFELVIFKTNFIINFFIRRLFIIPNYLHYSYFLFFKNNSKDFFKQSILRRIGLISDYSDLIPNLIGKNYYGGSYANNGLFSDAYSNLGIIGVLIMPIVLAFLLRALDYFTKGLDMNICLGIIIVLSYTLLSSSIFTVMLTHGFLVGLLIVWILPRGTN